MQSISKWFCTTSSKNMFVKIVHPGGHVELHDRPILAAELISRNPKCCVAHPTVFQQPHAVVSPETTLALGRKYYVVPLGTIRKLRQRYPQSHQAVDQENDRGKMKNSDGNGDDDDSSDCWLFRNSKNDDEKEEKGKNGCFQSMSLGVKMGGRNSESTSKERKKTEDDRKRDDKGSSAVEDRNGGSSSSSPGRLSLASMDNWQPGLESIHEE